MTDIKGYVLLKSDANCNFAMGKPSDWQNKVLRAMEINEDTKSVLVINSEATHMGMFKLEECERYFHCEVMNKVILPPNLNFMDKLLEFNKRVQRKGGYNDVIYNMVVMASLHSKEFNDKFLFQKQ